MHKVLRQHFFAGCSPPPPHPLCSAPTCPHTRTGRVFLQSDVLAAVEAMRDAFEQHAGNAYELAPEHSSQPVLFTAAAHEEEAAGGMASAAAAASSSGGGSSGGSDDEDADDAGEDEEESFVSQWATGGWLRDNPVGVPTEREHYVLQNGGSVYRVMLVKR